MYGLLIVFILYSFLGWCYEVILTATREKKYINKGFLNGAVCPRYGIAMVLSMAVLEGIKDHWLLVCAGSILIGVMVEYVSSVFLEKLTGSRWWSYKKTGISFWERVGLETVLFWGIGGTICFYVNNEVFLHFRHVAVPVWVPVVLIVFFILFFIDCMAALLTLFAIQDRSYFIIKVAAKIRRGTKKLGNRIFEKRDIRKMKLEMRRESARISRIYRKMRDERIGEWFRNRMILAAPDLAPKGVDPSFILKQRTQKKRKMFQKILVSRVFFTAVALILQICWLVVLLTGFSSLSNEIAVFMTLISLLITVFIIGKNENSAYKISWIVMILSFPLLGGVLYIFFGNKAPSRKMREKIKKVKKEKGGCMKQDPAVFEEIVAEDKRTAGRCRYLYEITGAPVWKHTETTYFPLGDDMFEDMIEELEKAQHFIFLEYFIIDNGIFWGSIVDVLKRKAKEGLDVRLMYDDIGCLMLLPKEYVKEMEEAGISCIAFNPFQPILSLAMNNRDHRKILVIDGHTAYTGGVNLADEYINMDGRFGHWKDTGMKFVGDGAANFTQMFLEMWNAFRDSEDSYEKFMPSKWKSDSEWEKETDRGTGFVQPFGDTPLDDDPTAENLYIDILNTANQYVYIYTPYLIISDTMQHALCMAAARGVDVKIITPGIPDKKIIFRMTRSNYKELLKAGVEIYEYKQGFLHAKSYVSDDLHGVIGTINMDYRSLYLHFECGAYLYKTDSIMEMKCDFLHTLKKSRKIELSFLRQGVLQEILDAVLKVIAPLV